MYVKASVSETAEDGGAILRVRYMDKDGVQQLKDSEIIKKTTEGFVRLTNTFTVPEDSSDTVVKVYMVMILILSIHMKKIRWIYPRILVIYYILIY